MVNWLHLHSTFLVLVTTQSTLNCTPHSPIHTHMRALTHTGSTAIMENLGFSICVLSVSIVKGKVSEWGQWTPEHHSNPYHFVFNFVVSKYVRSLLVTVIPQKLDKYELMHWLTKYMQVRNKTNNHKTAHHSINKYLPETLNRTLIEYMTHRQLGK